MKLFQRFGLAKQTHLLAILIAGSQRPRGGPSFLETEKAQELYSVIVGLASVGFQDFCKVPICYRLPLEDVVLCLGHNKLGDDQLAPPAGVCKARARRQNQTVLVPCLPSVRHDPCDSLVPVSESAGPCGVSTALAIL